MKAQFHIPAFISLFVLTLCVTFVPHLAHAASSATWDSGSTLISKELWPTDVTKEFCYANCDDHSIDYWGILPAKYLPIADFNHLQAAVRHSWTVTDTTSGTVLTDNGTVAIGDAIVFTPTADSATDITWFASGGASDSPYGIWGGSGANSSCTPSTNGYISTSQVSSVTFVTCMTLHVVPTAPVLTKGGTAHLSCDSGGLHCTVTSAGTITATLTYPSTTGKFYYSYTRTGQFTPAYEDWTYSGGHASTYPVADASKVLSDPDCTKFDPGGIADTPKSQREPSSQQCYVNPAYAFILQVPDISMTTTFNAAQSNRPPTMAVTGPTTGSTGSSITFSFRGVDPDGDQVKYGVDWDNNGTVDAWIPATGFVTSGTSQSGSHTWSTAGTYTFQALAQDSKGSNSTWATHSVTISATPAAPSALLTADPSSIASGDSSTLQWTCANSTSASITTLGAVTPVANGTRSVSPTVTTTYTLTCAASGQPSATDTATVSVGNPNLTAGDGSKNPRTGITGTAGSAVTLQSIVSNVGNSPTGVPFTDTFFIDDDANHNTLPDYDFPTFTSGIPNGFPANYSEPNAQNTFTFDQAGTYYYRVCADDDASMNGVVTETNEADNCTNWSTITIAANPKTLTCTVTPATVNIGDTATYTASPGNLPLYTWTPSDGVGSYGHTKTATRTFDAVGNYGMQVSASGYTSGNCPVVAVGNVCTDPTGKLSASPDRIKPGDSTDLTYSATGVSGTCTLKGPGVNVSPTPNSCTIPEGKVNTGPLTTQSTYILSCNGTELARQIVNVVPKFDEF